MGIITATKKKGRLKPIFQTAFCIILIPSYQTALVFKHQPAVIGFNFNAAVGRIATFQKRFGQRVFDFRLNCAFERAGAIHGVEAGFGDDVQRGIVHMQMQVLGGQAFFETAQLDFGDAADIGLIQAVEHHHFVDAVDQLGAEMRFHVFHHHFFHRFVIGGAEPLDVLG